RTLWRRFLQPWIYRLQMMEIFARQKEEETPYEGLVSSFGKIYASVGTVKDDGYALLGTENRHDAVGNRVSPDRIPFLSVFDAFIHAQLEPVFVDFNDKKSRQFFMHRSPLNAGAFLHFFAV